MGNNKLYKKTNDYIEDLSRLAAKPLYELTPDEARMFLRMLQKENYKELKADVYDSQLMTSTAGIVPVRFIRPQYANEQRLPIIIYCHGGGFIMGDSYTHDYFIKKLAIKSNVCIAFVDYARAPEAKFPIAFNQVYAAIEYIYNNPDEYKIDRERILLMGDSAGANLVISCAIKLNKESSVRPAAQFLLYPAIDIKMNTKSYKEFENGPWLTKKAMKLFWNAYKSCLDDEKNIYFSPSLADNNDLKGLSPSVIITAENDVLRDEGENFALKLDEAGVRVYCSRINGTIHDFLMLNALKDTVNVNTAFSLITSLIRQAVSSGL